MLLEKDAARRFESPADACRPLFCSSAMGPYRSKHLREIASCGATIAEAISLAKERNDMHALVVAMQEELHSGYRFASPLQFRAFRLAAPLAKWVSRCHPKWSSQS